MTFWKNRKFTKKCDFSPPNPAHHQHSLSLVAGGLPPNPQNRIENAFSNLFTCSRPLFGSLPTIIRLFGKIENLRKKCDFSPPDPPHHQSSLSLVAGGLPPNPLNTVETTFSRLVTCPRPLFGSFPAIIRLFGKIKKNDFLMKIHFCHHFFTFRTKHDHFPKPTFFTSRHVFGNFSEFMEGWGRAGSTQNLVLFRSVVV